MSDSSQVYYQIAYPDGRVCQPMIEELARKRVPEEASLRELDPGKRFWLKRCWDRVTCLLGWHLYADDGPLVSDAHCAYCKSRYPGTAW